MTARFVDVVRNLQDLAYLCTEEETARELYNNATEALNAVQGAGPENAFVRHLRLVAISAENLFRKTEADKLHLVNQLIEISPLSVDGVADIRMVNILAGRYGYRGGVRIRKNAYRRILTQEAQRYGLEVSPANQGELVRPVTIQEIGGSFVERARKVQELVYLSQEETTVTQVHEAAVNALNAVNVPGDPERQRLQMIVTSAELLLGRTRRDVMNLINKLKRITLLPVDGVSDVRVVNILKTRYQYGGGVRIRESPHQLALTGEAERLGLQVTPGNRGGPLR